MTSFQEGMLGILFYFWEVLTMNKKAIVFVDANNWYHNVKKLFDPSKVDITKLADFLCQVKKYDLLEVRWYASTPSIADGESMYYRHMAFLQALEKKGVKVVTRKLQRLSNKEVLQKKRQVVAIKNVVSEDERDGVTAHKIPANEECLRNPCGFGLRRV